MRKLLALAALIAATWAEPATLVKRTITGKAVLPDGTAITTGKLVATPYGTVPADNTTGLLLPTAKEYTITSGSMTCTSTCEIVGPANYNFQVYVTTNSVSKRRAPRGRAD